MRTTGILALLLLVSVGLNAGLAWRLGRSAPPPAGPAAPWDAPDAPGDDARGARAREMMRGRLERLARQLDLTAAQRDTMRAVHEASAPLFFAHRAAIARLRRELRDLALAAAPDRALVRERQREVSRLQAELDSLVVESMVAEARVLSPEQRERYRRLVPWGEPGHRRGPGRRGG